ncbi:hypothetical protein [Paraburkholderia sp.]|nr:hypothetical protein [Paraburkholderia sp.]
MNGSGRPTQIVPSEWGKMYTLNDDASSREHCHAFRRLRVAAAQYPTPSN